MKVQLRYRKKVMKDEHAKKGLLNLSSGRKLLSAKEMRENMKQVLVSGDCGEMKARVKKRWKVMV